MSSSARHKSVKFSESIEDINKLKQMEDEEEEQMIPMKAATNFVMEEEEELIPMKASTSQF